MFVLKTISKCCVSACECVCVLLCACVRVRVSVCMCMYACVFKYIVCVRLCGVCVCAFVRIVCVCCLSSITI